MIAKKVLFALFILYFSASCEAPPGAEKVYRITVQNNSGEIVNVFLSKVYPDTSLPAVKPLLRGILPGSNTFLDSEEKWEKVFDELPQDTLSLFVLSSDTVVAHSWDEIRDEYKILKRYDLSYSDLSNNDWTVSYP
jgi:hypothetical protein